MRSHWQLGKAEPMSHETEPATCIWNRRYRVGAVLWAAFLAACVATALFFAVFDPLLLMRDEAPPAWISDRRSGYALGFFFFWAIGTLAAGLSAWLIQNHRNGALRG
jgi:hypothetical protein